MGTPGKAAAVLGATAAIVFAVVSPGQAATDSEECIGISVAIIAVGHDGLTGAIRVPVVQRRDPCR